MERKEKIALGITGIVLAAWCTYKAMKNEPVFDETEPTSPVEQIFPLYEATPTPRNDAPIRITYNSSKSSSYKN